MTLITKPMLAGKCESLMTLVLPVLATPKLDGIRCLRVNGKALSRKFLPIPNNHIRQTIEREFAGYAAEFDGEIMIPNRHFNELSGDVRRHDGKPDFRYHVFDHVNASIEHGGLSQPYSSRASSLETLSLPDFCVKVLPVTISSIAALHRYEEECLALGYEGVMVRSPASPYKCGRSTANEGYLLKIKRFEDSEAVIIGYECEYENQNIAEEDAFGRTKRSSHAENMVGKDRLGKLMCRTAAGVEFGIGTGFDAATRAELWIKRDKLRNKVVKFKHQPSGADEKPRFPVFLGFRDSWDM